MTETAGPAFGDFANENPQVLRFVFCRDYDRDGGPGLAGPFPLGI